jgi:hypothetical protein
MDFRGGQPRFTGENFIANCAAIAKFREFCTRLEPRRRRHRGRWTKDDHLIPIPGTRSRALEQQRQA